MKINHIIIKNKMIGGRYMNHIAEENGWTITFLPWEDIEGKERVAGRFKTTQEKDEFMKKIHQPVLVG